MKKYVVSAAGNFKFNNLVEVQFFIVKNGYPSRLTPNPTQPQLPRSLQNKKVP